MGILTYIYEAIMAVIEDRAVGGLQFTVGAVLILIVAAGVAYLAGYAWRRHQKNKR